jgi:tripartite motif-containing protein 71
MAIDGDRNLWVADRGNSRVQEFGPGGQRLLALGTRGTAPGQFIHPAGVSIDCHGLLTVTDADGNRVEQFALAAPPAAACTALPAPARPPAPRTPTLPEPPGPALTVRVLRSNGLLTRRVLPLRVGCDTACTLTAAGTLTSRTPPPKGHAAVVAALGAQTLTLRAGQTAIVRLALSRTGVARLRRALQGRRGLTALVQVRATATVGAPSILTSRVQATR